MNVTKIAKLVNKACSLGVGELEALQDILSWDGYAGQPSDRLIEQVRQSLNKIREHVKAN